jgi:hypothetical protein
VLGACQGGLRSGHLGLGHLDFSGSLLLPAWAICRAAWARAWSTLRRGLKLGQLYRGDL